MAARASVAGAFRHLQRGNALAAYEEALKLCESEPGNGKAYLAAGIALRILGRLPEARLQLEHAAALDPRDHAAAFELGIAFELEGRHDSALPHYERSASLKPGFAPAHFAAGLERFRRAQWREAIARFDCVLALEPANVEALVNRGQALAESGEASEAAKALERAVALKPDFGPGRRALGWLLHKSGRPAEAIAHLRLAVRASPRDVELLLDLAKACVDARRDDEARAAYEQAMALDPSRPAAPRAYGQFMVARGDFARASELFALAWKADPADRALPIFLAQTEFLLGRWASGWAAYRERESRRQFEAECERRGRPYRLAAWNEIGANRWLLVGEQGLGDVLFFLRFAPALKAAGARLDFAGDARLWSLLARTSLFERFAVDAWTGESAGVLPLLVGDLPALAAGHAPDYPPSIAIAPSPKRVESWRRRLEACGPRPWIGVTWRAGTPSDVLAHGLYKTVPIEALMRALSPLGGTVVALQRNPAPGEIDTASRALGRAVHDFSHANDDLEDILALVSVLDRHVGVSNTNMHLAEAAGSTADVLVPFPPEWRWSAAGPSPWYPGFRVHRQSIGFDWSGALAGLAQDA